MSQEPVPPSLLVSATYNAIKKAAVLKFYDPAQKKIILWEDKTGHKPYCYSRLSVDDLSFLNERSDVDSIKTHDRLNMITGNKEPVSKITVDDPLAIGGTQSEKSIRNRIDTWESDIKYYENYLYDNNLTVGRYYSSKGDEIVPEDKEIPDSVKSALKTLLWDRVSTEKMADQQEFRDYASGWADLLNQPIPEIRRLSFDIEVESDQDRIPDPKIAEKPVTAVGFASSDGLAKVVMLRRDGIAEGQRSLDAKTEVEFFGSEREMIEAAFKVIEQYPFVLTYNGDDFDMPYLYNRAKRLGISDKDNPFHMMRDAATLNHGVHIDLYRTFSNRSFQIYAFGNKYSSYSLNEVCKAVLGEEKTKYEGSLNDLNLHKMAEYCYNDARLTLKLTTFGNNILMDLLVVISRIGHMPIDDIARMGVSQWIRSLLYYEHRRRDALIPRRDELERRSEGVTGDAVIKDKKYRGGLVVDPKEGIHFGVTVMDFASLYPSIIKVRNISYETVRCPHEECRKNEVPGTSHWTCSKKNGITALLIGSLRDLRVNYYKALSKDKSLTEEQRQQYTVVSQALKVILNASYGVMGAEIFPLYFLPAAEATTAVGRHIIMETISHCEGAGIEVLYGDTDSVFIKKPTKEDIDSVISYTMKSHGVELEVDKEYRYVVLSGRKKNYFGVTLDGRVDIKGLTGKKSHTPPFIKSLFYGLLDVLAGVKTKDDFNLAKKEIGDKISACVKRLEAREIPIEEMSFRVMLSKAPSEYIKTVPQHIRAAKMMEQAGAEIKKGDIISYVKVAGKTGVKPVAAAKPEDIEVSKYMEFMESTLDQITSSLGVDFAEIAGKPKQTGLEDFFY